MKNYQTEYVNFLKVSGGDGNQSIAITTPTLTRGIFLIMSLSKDQIDLFKTIRIL